MGRTKRWLALLLCGALAAGGVAWQLVPAVAESECSCEIEVHGSNCPLSRCSCDGARTGEHGEGCALYGLNSALAECVCQPDIHAEGCPRYEGAGELLQALSSAEKGGADQEPEQTPLDEAGAEEDAGEGPGSALTETAQEETETSPDTVTTEEDAGASQPETKEAGGTDAEGLDETESDPDETEEDWEYPSGWSGYGEGQMQGNVLVAAQAFELDARLEDHVAAVQSHLTNGDNARLSEEDDNFGDILAVYAVLSGQTEDYPYGIALEEEADVELLSSVYWSMTQVTGLSNAGGAAISIQRLTAAEGAELYNLTAEQKTEVLSLDGKVGYFWGGKSLAYGWDDRWGEMRTVASKGHSSYGTAKPLGLDCSGFVSWAFLNVFGADGFTATGTSTQWSDSVPVDWDEAQPGDLVFYYEPDTGQTNHVGIVVTVDGEGPETVVHCSGSGVHVSGAGRFSYVRRPTVYS